MENRAGAALDPAALMAFAGSLANLPKDEIRKAKKLYLLNAIAAIADFEGQRATMRIMLIAFGVMSILPVFLVIFIPALFAYRAGLKPIRQKILNALEVWRDDLGPDYDEIAARVP